MPLGQYDAEYRGEVTVVMINLGPEEFIAQMVIAKYETITWNIDDELSTTGRAVATNRACRFHF
jgi:dUTP pyrophosphatase